jgi:hypothetical protein
MLLLYPNDMLITLCFIVIAQLMFRLLVVIIELEDPQTQTDRQTHISLMEFQVRNRE